MSITNNLTMRGGGNDKAGLINSTKGVSIPFRILYIRTAPIKLPSS